MALYIGTHAGSDRLSHPERAALTSGFTGSQEPEYSLHTQESMESAKDKAAMVVNKLREMKLPQAAKIVENGAEETFSYYKFPPEHWQHIRTNNLLERLNKEIRRRTRVVGSFPDAESAIMLIAARLRHTMAGKWGTVKYMNMEFLKGNGGETEAA